MNLIIPNMSKYLYIIIGPILFTFGFFKTIIPSRLPTIASIIIKTGNISLANNSSMKFIY